MRIEHHLNKVKRFQSTLGKLNYEDDYETMIEDFMLASAHLINAAMHKLKTLPEDKDVKHNQLFGHLKREDALGANSRIVAELIQQLEQLRPSHVYGRGANGGTAKKAEDLFLKIKSICESMLLDEHEQKPG
ncbi:MAG TPA: hypothetical protein VJG31_00720 [Candidatus Nanoarchaeia archaeon]|nr:hypothetical protein [Candidatus Nanoarchaeia archaeon]